MDPKAVISQFIDEMNAATKSREYVPFAGKWFAPDGTLSLFYETHGIEKAQVVFKHIVPTGDDPTRKVLQFIYDIEGNMIHSFRRIESVIASGEPEAWREPISSGKRCAAACCAVRPGNRSPS